MYADTAERFFRTCPAGAEIGFQPRNARRQVVVFPPPICADVFGLPFNPRRFVQRRLQRAEFAAEVGLVPHH